jgi:hypothetical protein
MSVFMRYNDSRLVILLKFDVDDFYWSFSVRGSFD